MIKKLTALFITIILCLSFAGLTACKEEQTSSNSNVVLMNGFEYFDRDVQLIRIFNEFGSVDQNSNPEYVHSGEKSLKLTPLGSRVNTANPFLLLPTFSTRFEEVAFGDFSKVDKVSFWFYNAEEKIVNVGIGFGKGVIKMNTETRRDEIEKTNVEYFALNTGWNYIEYNVVPSYLALQGLNIKEVYGIVIEFDYVVSHKLADSPEVYLDDVYLTYLDQAKSTEFTMDVKTGTTDDGNKYWVVSDFENPLDAYFYSYNYKFPAPASAHPVIKNVFAGDYGVITETGTQVLLIQKKHGGTSYGWPGLVLSPEVLLKVFDAIGGDLKDNPQNYEIKFDIYNGSDYQGGWGIEYCPDYTNGQGVKVGLSFYDSVSVGAKKWQTHSYNIGTLVNKAIAVKESDPDADVKTFIEDPRLRFQWSRYNTEEDLSDRPFYLDNVRIEKIA